LTEKKFQKQLKFSRKFLVKQTKTTIITIEKQFITEGCKIILFLNKKHSFTTVCSEVEYFREIKQLKTDGIRIETKPTIY
jgi:hypothetical protein